MTNKTANEPLTCVLTGAEGENPDDCTTHEHETTTRASKAKHSASISHRSSARFEAHIAVVHYSPSLAMTGTSDTACGIKARTSTDRVVHTTCKRCVKALMPAARAAWESAQNDRERADRPRFQIVTNHGESASVFSLVDSHAPEEQQPAVVDSGADNREAMQTLADHLNAAHARGDDLTPVHRTCCAYVRGLSNECDDLAGCIAASACYLQGGA